MTNLYATGSQFGRVLKALSGRWIRTRALWTNAAGQDFERDFWISLDTSMPRTKKAIASLADVITGARHHVH